MTAAGFEPTTLLQTACIQFAIQFALDLKLAKFLLDLHPLGRKCVAQWAAKNDTKIVGLSLIQGHVSNRKDFNSSKT